LGVSRDWTLFAFPVRIRNEFGEDGFNENKSRERNIEVSVD